MSENYTNPPQTPVLDGYELGLVTHLPEELRSGLQDRQAVLQEFAADPTNPEIWNYVADQAHAEEEQNLGQPEELRDISVSDLVDFAASVRNTAPADRYDLTVQTTPNGKLWFDVLYGFHSTYGDQAISDALDSYTAQLGVENVETILDIGTGTGKTAAIDAKFATQTIAIDKDASLLAAAQTAHPNVEFIRGSVSELPMPDKSVDVITSDGIKYSLNTKTSEAMYREIARVLKPGGVYIDTDYAPVDYIILDEGSQEHPDFHPENLKTFITWRAALQDMIVDTVSGKADINDRLELIGNEWEALKHELCLKEFAHMESPASASFTRWLYKDPAATSDNVS